MRAEDYSIVLGARALRLLLVDWREHVSAVELADHLYERKRHELSVADLVVIRPCVYRQIDDFGVLVAELSPVFERVAKLPVYLLTSCDFKIALSRNVHPGVDDVLGEDELEAMVSALA